MMVILLYLHTSLYCEKDYEGISERQFNVMWDLGLWKCVN